ncbi:MAG TPA: VOC family protein [Trebonia sp.]|nr:VOC family protein [Trebonia sp.]
MAIARFKLVVLDAGNVARLGEYWAAALNRTWRAKGDRYGFMTGPTPEHRVWINAVPEPKTVKNRVHLDIYARSLADLEALGATAIEPFPRWTVMADPEGGEFCAFTRDDLPAERLHALVVDSENPMAQARWWGAVYGAVVVDKGEWARLEGVPGMPIAAMDFVRVPEPKTVKNRVHWDVTIPSADSLAALVSAGATVLREPDDDIQWHILADPEGNEFCVFTRD